MDVGKVPGFLVSEVEKITGVKAETRLREKHDRKGLNYLKSAEISVSF